MKSAEDWMVILKMKRILNDLGNKVNFSGLKCLITI